MIEKYYLVVSQSDSVPLKIVSFDTEAAFVAGLSKEFSSILLGDQSKQIFAFKGQQLRILGGQLNFSVAELVQNTQVSEPGDSNTTESSESVSETIIQVPIDISAGFDNKTGVISPLGNRSRSIR